ncbi:phosphoserine phosphatase SerB [Stappia sp.]|uniref:phosphoserine phosphatase SerB n=1 Tax=Stappia sp. TaxID=1870903 RepID=UPI0032D8CE5D
MSYVATLICDPARPVLDADRLAAVRACVPGLSESDTLAPGVAEDLAFELAPKDRASEEAAPEAIAEIERAIRDRLGDAPVDVVVQKRAGRRKRLLIADMDSTMIGQECIDELADVLGKKAEISQITERAMRGELEFEPALRERAAMLAGLDAGIVDTVLATKITVTPGARMLVQTMRADGAYCALVSGGFTVFTSVVAEWLGFHEHRANRLESTDGKLTGRVAEPILGRQAKRDRLSALLAEQGLPAEAALAVGDGANDLAMIDLAGLGVAYHAKPAVAAVADARIDHGDLTALLYIQGYRAADFVRD